MVTTNLDRYPTVLTAEAEQSGLQNPCCTMLFAESVASDPQQGGAGTGASQSSTHSSSNGPNGFVAAVIAKHEGNIVKTVGNSVIAEFPEPILAVQAAVEMQKQSEAVQGASGKKEGLRIGIYSLMGANSALEMFGSMISAVSTITKQASSGQILISNTAYQEASRHPAPHCSWSRSIKIDGGAKSEELFEVTWREASPANIPSRYEVLSEVGKGGMGIVHKVLDRETGEILALKILKPEIAGEPEMQENLKREVCLARKVTHKNVCRIHEFNRTNAGAFISMEFVEGESLQSMLNRAGALSWNQVVPIAQQICAGLREAHLQGIVHRDLKPANIMVDTAGNVKVMDFGIARLFQGTGQLTGTMIGTPAYMAPEQLELKRVDARTDIYAVGLLLYEMITGSQPFVGDTPIAVALKHIREIPQRPREIVPSLPAHAEAVIMKCLQKDAAKRFQSVNELMMAINRAGAARPAASQWNQFVSDFRGFGQDIKQGLQHGAGAGQEFLGRQDWRALAARPTTKKIAAGLGAACLLGAVIGISVHGSRKTQVAGTTANSPVATESKPNSEMSAANLSARADGSKTITSFHVDLEKSSGRKAEKKQPATHAEAVVPAVSHVAPPEAKTTRAQRNAKPQNVALVSASVKTVTPVSAAPAPSVAATSATANSKADDSAAAPSEGTTVFANPYAGAAPSEASPSSSTEGLFLEVGSFKDPAWADQAVAKLTQLGFQSFSVHKAKLWMQSYQVRVGPFADQGALEEARENLVTQGFKPHPVK